MDIKEETVKEQSEVGERPTTTHQERDASENLESSVQPTNESTMASSPGSANTGQTEEGAALDAAVFNDAFPAQLQEGTPLFRREMYTQPSPEGAMQSLPQSQAESADAAVQSCLAGSGTIDVSLLLAQEFVLVLSSKVWDPGGLVLLRRCGYGGWAYDNVVLQGAQYGLSYAISVR